MSHVNYFENQYNKLSEGLGNTEQIKSSVRIPYIPFTFQKKWLYAIIPVIIITILIILSLTTSLKLTFSKIMIITIVLSIICLLPVWYYL
tara:strand:+ start:201 stop:470 length:270 start_codon:yes stop_codon:yes gene_type:complete